MNHHPTPLQSLLAGALLALPAQAAPFFTENFDALILAPTVSSSEFASYDPDGAGPLGSVTNVWTATTPTGWTMTKGPNHVNGAVAEFDGWTFVDPVWWNATAGQNRNLFTKGQGVIAVADSDEYDDLASGTQRLEATLSSPPIDITGKPAGGIVLRFDSSWRQEPQTGIVTVSYDGGAPVTVLTYDSSTPTAYDATVEVPLANPAGAASMVVAFYHTGANNWWWAVDNFKLTATTPLDGFATWANSFGIAADENGDGDRDGIRDLVEYALGLHPKVGNTLPGLTPNGEGFTMSYTKGTEAAADPGITYILETSGNLVDWLPTGTQNQTSITTELPGGQGRLFGRLRIERAR
jgi:hypothetical protein